MIMNMLTKIITIYAFHYYVTRRVIINTTTMLSESPKTGLLNPDTTYTFMIMSTYLN